MTLEQQADASIALLHWFASQEIVPTVALEILASAVMVLMTYEDGSIDKKSLKEFHRVLKQMEKWAGEA